jgi:hypothetical protein
LFYTHEYPLREGELAEVEDIANQGAGIYLYFMAEHDQTIIPVATAMNYLAVNFKDG